MGYSYFNTRLAHIMACLYLKSAEIVEDITNEECYIFLGQEEHEIEILWEEMNCLLQNDIIEVESGCDEPGHESRVYCLTEQAIKRIKILCKK